MPALLALILSLSLRAAAQEASSAAAVSASSAAAPSPSLDLLRAAMQSAVAPQASTAAAPAPSTPPPAAEAAPRASSAAAPSPQAAPAAAVETSTAPGAGQIDLLRSAMQQSSSSTVSASPAAASSPPKEAPPPPGTNLVEYEKLKAAMLALTPSTAAAKGVAGSTATARAKEGPANLSGIVLMPSAFRGTGRDDRPGIGLDINAAYYIGRLYGKNDYPWTLTKTNYIDRIGLWLLTADGKIQVQSDGPYRPALAVGAMGTFAFRDSPQPNIATGPQTTVHVSHASTQRLVGTYAVASKRLPWHFILHLGYEVGEIGNAIPLLSEYLSKQALVQDLILRNPTSEGMLFAGITFQPKPEHVYTLEIMQPQGMPLNPTLFNLQLGTLLKLNFQISYLRYTGGYDFLGMFQFRYSAFPKT